MYDEALVRQAERLMTGADVHNVRSACHLFYDYSKYVAEGAGDRVSPWTKRTYRMTAEQAETALREYVAGFPDKIRRGEF